jgi:hypothetical protein
MGILVELPAPSCKGTYLVLVEPEVVRVGTSSCIRTRLGHIRVSTFRRVALLAWSTLSEQYVHESFSEDRITITRGFFRLSPRLLSFINECRVELGFEEVESILLWEFGGPIPYKGLPRVPSARVGPSDPKPTQISSEESSRKGRYYTHLRWHKNKPKDSCEFCAQEPRTR